MKTQRIDLKLPLRNEILLLKNPTKEKVRKLYGEFGLDVYEGKKDISIYKRVEQDQSTLKKIFNKITGIFSYKYEDYKDGDSFLTVLLKYTTVKDSGTYEELNQMFGEKGIETMEQFKRVGYATDLNLQ